MQKKKIHMLSYILLLVTKNILSYSAHKILLLFSEILIEKVFAEPKSAAGENFLKIAYF